LPGLLSPFWLPLPALPPLFQSPDFFAPLPITAPSGNDLLSFVIVFPLWIAENN
jgi:hypothetical protein